MSPLRAAAAALFLATLAPSTGALANPTPDAASYVGRYEHAGGAADERARVDAIEATVMQLPALFRGVARDKLMAGSGVPGHYEIELDGEQIAIGIDSGEIWHSPLDGTPVELSWEGKPFTLRRTLVDGVIVSEAEQKGGSGRFVFLLSADGETLTVTTTMDSPLLPAPVEYVSTYRRR